MRLPKGGTRALLALLYIPLLFLFSPFHFKWCQVEAFLCLMLGAINCNYKVRERESRGWGEGRVSQGQADDIVIQASSSVTWRISNIDSVQTN